MTITKLSKSDSLLFRTYCRRVGAKGTIFDKPCDRQWVVSSSAVHTCDGKPAIWRYLVQTGMVEKDWPSPLGHPFNFKITELGKSLLGDICREENRALGLETA